MNQNLLPSLRYLLVFFTVLFSANFANAGACSYSVTTTAPGVDTIECEPGFFCMDCVPCCSAASVYSMTQAYFNDYRRNFIMGSFYSCPVDRSFRQSTDEYRNAFLLRIAAFGAFLDASILNDTLKDLQLLSAESLKTYTPSDQICRFGTLSRALAQSESKMDTDRLLLSEVGLSKNLGKTNTISTAGLGADFQNRLALFSLRYCDLRDNNNGLSGLCPPATPSADTNLNRDIDYTRLMETGVTLNTDLTDVNLTPDETNLVALSHFLYGHRQPSKRISTTTFNEKQGSVNLYADYRSVVARRAAAQNTFNTLAAMKMAGSGGSDAYLRQVLAQIGLSGNAADRYLGAGSPPVRTSYNAQMNLLTKQIFQDPSFYANLMESKVNVKRASASLQGLGLMQARDTYKSMTRSEMLLAILVELEALQISNNLQGQK